MAQALLANNAATTLSVAITSTSATSLTVVDASKFPIPTGGDYFYATLLDAANVPEIVKVTAVASQTFTVVRAQEGTTARTFTTGATVRLAVTKAVMDEFARLALSVQKAGDTYTGVHDLSGAASVSLPANTTIGTVTPTVVGYLTNITSDVQSQINSKAPSNNPTFTGTVTIPAGASISGYVTADSPIFTGDPRTPTPAQGDNDTSIANTAFVQTALLSFAPLTSPAFTGTPTAPTPSAATADNQIATTSYVQTVFTGGAVSSGTGQIRETYTATSGQTLFTLVNAYVVGASRLNVYVNGIRQFPSAYTETSTTSVTFSDGLTAGDVVLFENILVTLGAMTSAANVAYTGTANLPAGTVQESLTNLANRNVESLLLMSQGIV